MSNEDRGKFAEVDIEKIVSICNQEPVYGFLFREKLKGKEYQREQAESFIKWIVEGWQEQTHFAYLIRRDGGEIIGAVDIKSNYLERAEVGYWADGNYSGIMSNAVAKLVELAKAAGYKSLFATAKLDNQRSQNVLLRNGFVGEGEIDKLNVGKRLLFELAL